MNGSASFHMRDMVAKRVARRRRNPFLKRCPWKTRFPSNACRSLCLVLR